MTADRTLTCADCGQEFVFSASEQQFYADCGFSDPRRCPDCRRARKARARLGPQVMRGVRHTRNMTTSKRFRMSARLQQITFALISLTVILLGAAPLFRGDFFYSNYWGGLVFGPLAILIGLCGVCVAVFRWRKFLEPPERLKGRAARLAQRAAQQRSALDDFDKPWTGGA